MVRKWVENAIHANEDLVKGKHYLVEDNKIVIIDY